MRRIARNRPEAGVWRRERRRWLAVLAALTVCAAPTNRGSAGDTLLGPQPASENRADAEAALRRALDVRQTGPDTFAIGRVRFDRKERTVSLPARVNPDQSTIEYALVTEQGKTHESLLVTDVSPRQVHLACLLLGLGPAPVTGPQHQPESVPPTNAVQIEVTWEQNGRPVRHSLAQLVALRNGGTEKVAGTLGEGPWFYNGSEFGPEGFRAEIEGSIISLIRDPAALVNNPRASRDDDELHLPNRKLLPPDGTAVTVVLRLPRADSGPRSDAPIPLPAARHTVETDAMGLEELYRRAHAAAVEVLVEGRHSGSGWFATSNGWVVTAAHLFRRPGAVVEIVSPAHGRLAVNVLALDRGHDVAVLEAPPRAGGYATRPLAAQPPRVGEEIFQFGAPLFRAGVLQTGRVARPDTVFEFYGEPGDYVEVLHVSGMMQGGTSGGPWLNRRGEVVGLQSGLMSQQGQPLGVAYLVPAPAIGTLLARPRTAATPTLGLAVDHVWESPVEFLKRLPPRTQGLVISRLTRGGPAEQAGLKRKDVILGADGQPLVRIAELLRRVRARQPGQEMLLTVLRPDTGQTNACRVVLGLLEADWKDH